MQFDSLLPQKTFPIYIIGAGGIVKDAHLPAYHIAGFPVAGIYDKDIAKAKALASQFTVAKVFESLEEMINDASREEKVIFDVALPGSAIAGILEQLPDASYVLMQKPMGDNLEEAKKIAAVTVQKQHIAAVNFQLRYAPYILQLKKMLNAGVLGDICDVDVNVNVYTPWHLWRFLFDLPRVEILYHSIHYIDLVRNLLGTPATIYAKTTKHMAMQELASVKTNIIMDYGEWISASVKTYHAHNFSMNSQHAYIKVEGTKGAVKIKMGSLINYPHGVTDQFEYIIAGDDRNKDWQSLPVEGSWFPHAFIGSMAQLMLVANGEIDVPDNAVKDCLETMQCVEAAYLSSNRGGVMVKSL